MVQNLLAKAQNIKCVFPFDCHDPLVYIYMTCTSSQLRWQFVFHEWFKCVTFESWDGISSSSFQKKGGPADPMLKGSSDAPFLSLQGNFLELLWFPQTHWGLVSSARKLRKISSSPTGVAKKKKIKNKSIPFYWFHNTWHVEVSFVLKT